MGDAVEASVNGVNGHIDGKKPAVVEVSAPVDDPRPLAVDGKNETEDWEYPYPTDFKLSEHPVDEIRPLKVAIIGAGIGGINAGVLLPVKVPGIELTIFDKNDDVGGTWLENRYPGVRCDIPSHAYQATYAPNVEWSEEYAQGHEILAYWQSVARKFDVYRYCRFRTKILDAAWDDGDGKWVLRSQSVESAEVREGERFDFLITAIGHFNEWKIPDYPGIKNYRGHLRHSSDWDTSFDPTGKRVATIGNGASGIQVTTQLQGIAERVDHYARNKTWIAGSFKADIKERKNVAMPFSQEQLQEFKDPDKYLAFRKVLEGSLFRGFDAIMKESDTTKTSREAFQDLMRQRLGGDEELLAKLVPDFPPFCRRLTPGPGYLEAITKPNLDFIQTPIDHFTETGIVTKDGTHREVDAVICSTGANVHFAPPFPIKAGDYDLSRDWRPEGKFGFPYNYLGVATPGFPNLAYILGPNPPGISGTVPHGAEVQITYIAKMLRKLSSQGIKSLVPSKQAGDDFLAYCDAFFPRTNMSMKCSSWYNGGRPGARIHGVWPGSSTHLARILREPRWEDFEYRYSEGRNRFAYFGDGTTKKEIDPECDLTPYLRLEGENDLRNLHERWWEV